MPILKVIDLKEYKKSIERQKDWLPLSLILTDEDIIRIGAIYDELIEITENRLLNEITVITES